MNICVYGAASDLINKKYIEEGENLGFKLAEHGHSLVFGGGGGGLMGAVARGAHRHGGVKITGVVPSFFTAEGKHVDGLLFEHSDEKISTETMRERKHILENLSDAFIITPGGIGTFDEYFEMITLKSLGRHNKPMAILNTNGYYDSLISMVQKGIDEGFIRKSVLDLVFVSENIDEVLGYIEKQYGK